MKTVQKKGGKSTPSSSKPNVVPLKSVEILIVQEKELEISKSSSQSQLSKVWKYFGHLKEKNGLLIDAQHYYCEPCLILKKVKR